MFYSDKKSIELTLGKNNYCVHIEKKDCHRQLIRDYIAEDNLDDVVIITDENVASYYSDLLEGFKTIVIPSGEHSKCISMYALILERLSNLGITRKGLIIAFGGGVVGDLAGFAAATYMRGIRLIQVPTTLLAMVDSSVGGKVGINLSSGKNQVGSFYQPDAVYINQTFLKTLPKREWSNGMAEIIKVAVGFDERLLNALEVNFEVNLEAIIVRCIEIKAEVVMRDEKDEGIRNLLNFGHTIGHAIEKYYDYERYLHGEAVAIGIAAKSKIAYNEGLINEFELNRILDLLKKYDLPTELHEDLMLLLEGIRHDKKAESDKLNWIGLKSIGSVEIRTDSFDEAIMRFAGGLRVKKVI